MASQMKQSVLVVLVAGLLVGVGASPASAVVILEDDFSGAAGAPNAAKWDVTGTPVLNGSGQLVMDATAGGTHQVIGAGGGAGSYGFQPTAGVYGKMTATAGPISGPGGPTAIGLTTNAAGTDELTMRVFHGGSWYLSIFTNGGNDGAYFSPAVAQGAVGTWEIYWYADKALVYWDGDLRIDTSSDIPFQTFGTWSLPSVSMVPYTYKAAEFAFTADSITWESIVVPEPASLVLLGTGVLAMLRRRHY